MKLGDKRVVAIASIVIIIAIVSLAINGKRALRVSPNEPVSKEVETAHDEHSLELRSIWNDRELGGYKASDGRNVKHGLLIRTAGLHEASDKDLAILSDKYNVGMIVDFRDDNEIAEYPDRIPDGVDYRQVKITEDINAVDFTKPFYLEFLETDIGKRGYGEMFQTLVDMPDDKAFLWHCTSGRDRTGVAAMLILSALDVGYEDIMTDYLLTNLEEYDSPVSGGASGSNMEAAISELTERYGSVRGYITGELGVSEEDIKILKDRYLE